jgi:integrase
MNALSSYSPLQQFSLTRHGRLKMRPLARDYERQPGHIRGHHPLGGDQRHGPPPHPRQARRLSTSLDPRRPPGLTLLEHALSSEFFKKPPTPAPLPSIKSGGNPRRPSTPWTDGDCVWCQRNGRPIGAHADWDEWKALLKETGIRDAPLHDARHTAATLAQGVDQRVVMEILSHSQISMTAKYAHVLPQVMTDAADRVGQALWGQWVSVSREANCN